MARRNPADGSEVMTWARSAPAPHG